ncbi:MAG: nitroreductase family protein [Candidatus Thermoplasmatota archaeon]|nr:nitroreductase family protein [Candidatus Thermoplasmatota archaeon]
MDLDTVIEKRHSVRSYCGMVPADNDMERIVAAARKAPSAGNLKAFKVFVLRSGTERRRMMESTLHQTFISEAPYLLLFCADLKAIEPYGGRGKELFCVQDATIAAVFAMLKATELGLGTCWVGAFDEDKVREASGSPPHLRPVAILTVGDEK